MTFKTFLIVCAAAVSTGGSAQKRLYPEFCRYDDWAAIYGACTAVDVNNDGFCDMVIAGFGKNVTNTAGNTDNEKRRMTHVIVVDPKADMLRWHALDDKKTAMNVSVRPSLTPCDINRDGVMDIVAFETTGQQVTDQPYTDGVAHEGIFIGNGDGTFEECVPTIIDEDGNEVGFEMAKILSGTVADVNNDGLLDIVGIGYQVKAGVSAIDYETCNYILVNRGNNVFQQQPIFAKGDVYHFTMGWVRCYDVNNDGLQDIIISAQSNDNAALNHTATCIVGDSCDETHFLDIFLNNREAPGTFTRQYLQDRTRWKNSAVWAVGECGMSIGDVNNDGVSDLYIVGYSGNGRSHDVWGLFIATLQEDGSVKYNVDYSCPIELARPLNTVGQQCGFIDWTGDGNLDYYAPGWYQNYSTQTACLYTNAGDGKFTKAYRIGSGSEMASCFVDWDADGVNDIVEMGQSWDSNFFVSGGYHFQATLNSVVDKEKITPPQPPILLPAKENDGKVTIAWQRNSESKANVTYEYWVRNSKGELVTSCNSHIGGDLDGRRKVVGPGNACQSNAVTLSLPKGDYTYGVQTIDASYHGSIFAVGSFTVETTGIDEIRDTGNGKEPTRRGKISSHYFSLSGKDMGTEYRKLPKGVYVKDNKKTTVR